MTRLTVRTVQTTGAQLIDQARPSSGASAPAA